MQKQLLILGTLTVLLLAACQNVEDNTTKSSAPEAQTDKAETTSKVVITVPGDQEASPSHPTVTIINDNKGLIVDQQGFLPQTLTAKVGDTLTIFNSQEKQVDLYTTAEGSSPCPTLDATIEIPGLESKEIVLEKAASCDIINQLNTDQKATLTVE